MKTFTITSNFGLLRINHELGSDNVIRNSIVGGFVLWRSAYVSELTRHHDISDEVIRVSGLLKKRVKEISALS